MRVSILVTGILCLVPYTFGTTSQALAEASRCYQSNYQPSFCENSSNNILAESKWHQLAARFYQHRYRVRFKPDNKFLQLQDVVDILGFTGVRTNISKHNSHQYWYWQDTEQPNLKIEAVFVYGQLASLRSRGFDPQPLRALQTEINSQINRERITEHRIFP